MARVCDLSHRRHPKRVLSTAPKISEVVIDLEGFSVAYLDWYNEAAFRPEDAFLLFVVFIQDREYTLTIETAPALSFPLASYADDDADYVLRFMLESTSDPSFTHNQVTFHQHKPKVITYVEEAQTWAEELLLTPMDRLVRGVVSL